MKTFWLIFLGIVSCAGLVPAQDCIDYHLKSCPRLEPNPYTVVPEGSQSSLLKRGEKFELSFKILQGRDYRITLCSNMYNGEVVLQLYDVDENGLLLYDNTQNEQSQAFEFQVFNNRRVRAVVSLAPQKESTKKNTGLLIEKQPRDCVGLLLETMVTRK